MALRTQCAGQYSLQLSNTNRLQCHLKSGYEVWGKLQIKRFLTVWAVFVDPDRCRPTNDNRANERPLGNQDNPLHIMPGIQAEEED